VTRTGISLLGASRPGERTQAKYDLPPLIAEFPWQAANTYGGSRIIRWLRT